jgi:hypothetical protein
MEYTDALKYLKENKITKDDGSFYEFGDVSVHGHTMYLCKFPISSDVMHFSLFKNVPYA